MVLQRVPHIRWRATASFGGSQGLREDFWVRESQEQNSALQRPILQGCGEGRAWVRSDRGLSIPHSIPSRASGPQAFATFVSCPWRLPWGSQPAQWQGPGQSVHDCLCDSPEIMKMWHFVSSFQVCRGSVMGWSQSCGAALWKWFRHSPSLLPPPLKVAKAVSYKNLTQILLFGDNCICFLCPVEDKNSVIKFLERRGS